MQKTHDTRIFGLDIIRAVAILCVLLAHTATLITSRYSIDPIAALLGIVGVELFFVLSGFLIGGIIIKLWQKNEGLTFAQVKSFWVRRWLRTLPTYYLALIVAILVEFIIGHQFVLADPRYFSYFIFLQNSVHYHPSFFGIAWSLSIEEWFYLLFPIGVLIVSFFSKKKKEIIITGGLFLVFFLVVRLVASGYIQGWDNNFRKLMPFRLDAIAAGVVAVYCKLYKPDWWAAKKKWLIVGIMGLIAGLFYFYNSYLLRGNETVFLKTGFFTVVSLSVACLMPYFDSITTATRKWWHRAIIHISIISYSMYLFHWIILSIVKALFVNSNQGVMSFGTVWILTLVVASLVYKYYEYPMTQLRERFTSKG